MTFNDYLMWVQPFIDKYRPKCVSDLVLSPTHGLAEAFEYLRAPYASAWLLLGKPGLGKTSLARLMADVATQGCELAKQVYSGPDLTIDIVRSIAMTCRQKPLPGFGLYHTIIVDEADAIPRMAQIRLLALLEDLENAVFLFTSNETMDDYESRFLSRLKILPFTAHGLLEPATEWLLGIAAKESIPLNRAGAERMIKQNRSNLRASLQELDSLGARNRAQERKAPPLLLHPVANPDTVLPKAVAV